MSRAGSGQWAYLFERFPSFTQTFCQREVSEIQRQGCAPFLFSIRRPRDEPAQDFPADLASEVRYLPEEGDLADEFRWLKRCDRLPETLRDEEQRLKGARDKARIQEAGWLGARMKLLGIRHVHAHFAGIAARTAYWLHRHFRIGFSFTAHANDVFSTPDPQITLTLESLVREARFVVAVSDFAAAQLRERFPESAEKIHRVYNGISLNAFPPADPARSKPCIIAVGRYIIKKGFGDLIAACGQLRDRGISFDCEIIGEGPLDADLAQSIRERGLTASVRLTGPMRSSEVAAKLAQARVFALPCVTEPDGGMDNLPTVIAEAMAAGLPVVSTRLAGVPEMVADAQTGFLVPPGDPTALAESLARLLSDPALAARLGRAGLDRARALFGVRTTARQFKRLLLTSAALRPPRAALWRDPSLIFRQSRVCETALRN